MNQSGFSGLLDQETLAARVERGDAPDWVAAHWTSFRDGLLGARNGSPSPCFFGVGSEFPDECPLSISRDHPKAVASPLDSGPRTVVD